MAAKTKKITSAKAERSASIRSKGAWKIYLLSVLFGALFGYFLSKGRATDYETVLKMFLFKDFRLYGVIIVAVITVSAGLAWLNLMGHPTFSGKKLDWKKPTWQPQRLIGAFLFGAGWALAGTWPGTSVSQLGEGKLVALFTVTGIFLGVWAYSRFMPDASSDEVC